MVNASATVAALLLVALLCLAVFWDSREHRIPNRLVLLGIIAGLGAQLALPAGAGLFDVVNPGALGLKAAALGLLVGFAVLLPLYLLRAMGAGDVKLMAMVGVFLGPIAVLEAALWALACGGVMTVVVALWRGVLRDAISNVRFILLHAAVRAMTGGVPTVEAGAVSAGRMPYALAIAGGTFMQLVLSSTGRSIF